MATIENEVITTEHVAELGVLFQEKKQSDTLPPEALDIESLIKAVHMDSKGSFEKMLITEDIFKKIKDSLIATIQSMEKNPSLFSQAAEFWGELPLWQKIVGGASLTLPTLILGLVANIGFLLALCGITTIAYAGSGIILDDHHNHTVSITDSLTKGILGLADLLELTISALDKIRQKLSDEVEKFGIENTKLQENNLNLSNKLEQLSLEITAARELSEGLKKTKNDLEEAAIVLKGKMAEQSDLLSANQEQLKRTTADYHDSQILLSEKIAEFSKIQSDLNLELDKARYVVTALQSAVALLSDTVIVDKQHQQEFKERLEEFLKDKGKNFDSIAGRISESEKKLALTEEKLRQCNEEYQTHIQEMRTQIERLTKLADNRQEQVDAIREARKRDGFFATEKCSDSHCTQQVPTNAVPPLQPIHTF